ncbi:5-(carboxyamino)imidazole ribonucleotide synthase [Pseudohoeflea coraliihabitans]|uniref:N5-carboxyaminoimidazole ribonucleotide synthase n=1 Tax=Pseudohoeflea coraliihabitans TaxID=2860393 RepID=A0ABS6WS16_9HYPH|nr:5-(carboxyamino)imidazole ribonucleotide synthase [Pseudohoeflea sp. DP4N28-3]MBW3097860.1 5-(carboxyamino)imidazole ribonucleotide synthase [Pseudohoeflea sp. DP4N28-3]
MDALRPGATIGILGGGQLGRMLAMAAARFSYRTIIFDPDAAAPAAQLASAHICAGYDDQSALDRLAEACDVVTYEFENVPVETVRHLAGKVPVRPGARALETAQHRILEKEMARRLGAETAAFAPVQNRADLDAAIASLGLPAILKTTRFGYDGKGQARLTSREDAAAALEAMAGGPAILESFVPFDREVSLIAARGIDGTVTAFDLVENEHRNHILHRSTVPASIDAAARQEATRIAAAILADLDYVGVLAVEFFAVPAETGHRLLVNEIAPRVHNSGHWTEAACVVSQFEQHIRAIAGLPLQPALRHSDCVMQNLIGEEVDRLPELADDPAIFLHLYGKKDARPGRKMGHFTRLVGKS